MLEYRRYRAAAGFLHERLDDGARLPLPLGAAAAAPAARVGRGRQAVYEPEQLARAIGDLLRVPPPIDLRHLRRPAVSVEQRLATCATCSRAARRFSFDDAVRGADRLTEAVTLFALLELYKAGEASGSRRCRSARSP